MAKESASLLTGLVHTGSAGESFHSASNERRTLTYAHKHTRPPHSHQLTSAGLCATPWRDDVIVSGLTTLRRAAGKRRAVVQKRSSILAVPRTIFSKQQDRAAASYLNGLSSCQQMKENSTVLFRSLAKSHHSVTFVRPKHTLKAFLRRPTYTNNRDK